MPVPLKDVMPNNPKQESTSPQPAAADHPQPKTSYWFENVPVEIGDLGYLYSDGTSFQVTGFDDSGIQ